MAVPNRPTDLYRQGAINGASPLQLVVMLYDGALRHMAAGQAAMRRKDTFNQNWSLQAAQKIVGELISCLDMDKGAEIAQNLLALYSYCYNCLVEANLSDKTEAIDQARAVLTSLRESWAELERQVRPGQEPERAAA